MKSSASPKYQLILAITSTLFLLYFLFPIVGEYFGWTDGTDDVLLSMLLILPVILPQIWTGLFVFSSLCILGAHAEKNYCIQRAENRRAYMISVILCFVLGAWELLCFGYGAQVQFLNDWEGWDPRAPIISFWYVVGMSIFELLIVVFVFMPPIAMVFFICAVAQWFIYGEESDKAVEKKSEKQSEKVKDMEILRDLEKGGDYTLLGLEEEKKSEKVENAEILEDLEEEEYEDTSMLSTFD